MQYKMEYGNSDTKYFRYIQIGSNIFEIPRNSIFSKNKKIKSI